MTITILLASFVVILAILIVGNAFFGPGPQSQPFKVETSWVMAALAPTIIWLVGSGQLAEVTGFGFGFKLRQAWNSAISLERDGERIVAKPIKELVKEAENAAALAGSNSITVTLPVGSEPSKELVECIVARCRMGRIVFTDESNAFVAMAESGETWVHATLLEAGSDEKQRELVKALIKEKRAAHFEPVISRAISTDDSRDAALKKILMQGGNTLPVIDDQRRFKGVIDKQKLLENMVLDLVAR